MLGALRAATSAESARVDFDSQLGISLWWEARLPALHRPRRLSLRDGERARFPRSGGSSHPLPSGGGLEGGSGRGPVGARGGRARTPDPLARRRLAELEHRWWKYQIDRLVARGHDPPAGRIEPVARAGHERG